MIKKGQNVRNRIVAGLMVASVALTGCSRSIDIEQTGATPVPGAKGLHRLCDQSTLIYVTIISGSDDEYEAFFYGGCVWDEPSKTFIPAIGKEAEPRVNPKDSATDETNQQDERNEKD